MLFACDFFRPCDIVLTVARKNRRLSLGSLSSNNDRVRQTFGAAAVVTEYFIGFLAAGAFGGDLLQLVFEFFFGKLSAFEAAARFDDFLDVKLENIAPPELAFSTLAPSQEHAEAPPALLQG